MLHAVHTRYLAAIPQATALCFACACAVPAHADALPHGLPTSTSVAADAKETPAKKEPGRLDATAPFLYSIGVSGSVNAQAPNQSILVELDIRDNISGVASYDIELASPSGTQFITRHKVVGTPLLRVTPTLTVGMYPYSEPDFSVYDEPGTWRVVSLTVVDAAKNSRTYNESQLEGFGNTAFTVMNNGGYDVTAPAFASGTIETPTVRRSKPPKGLPAGTPPFVSANISLTDSGNGLISGNHEAFLALCHVDSSGDCDDYLYLDGTTNEAGGLANTITSGTQMRADQTVGQYVIYYLDAYDVAGNVSTYVSTQFGGGTNFATYFPQGATIFISQ